MPNNTRRRASGETSAATFRFTGGFFSRLAYQRPTAERMMIAVNAASEKKARLGWPNGTTINAASSGPIAVPRFPPT